MNELIKDFLDAYELVIGEMGKRQIESRFNTASAAIVIATLVILFQVVNEFHKLSKGAQ
jgi:hypothetical protein